MTPQGIVTSLEGLDIETAHQHDLERAGRLARELRGFLDVIDARMARRAAALHEQGQAIPPEDLLARASRSSRREAERARRRAEALGTASELERQLANGRISTEHADAVATAAGRLDDAQRAEFLGADTELAQAAAAMSPEQFRRFANRRADQLVADGGVDRSERQRARASLSVGIVDETGMGFIRGELHPDDFQRVRRAVRGEVAALRTRPEHRGLRNDQLQALALVNLVTGARSSRSRGRTEVAVVMDQRTFMSGRHADSVSEYSDGSSLPVATARRLACDAEIIPVVLGGDGQPLDVGRARRLATPEQRIALRAMYRTCAIDGCHRSFDDCEIHHLLEWIDNGFTDLVNLLPLCSHHHHRSHEGRWRLELDPATRQLSVWLPDGTLLCRCRPDIVAERAGCGSARRAA